MGYEEFMFYGGVCNLSNKQETLSLQQEMVQTYNNAFEEETLLDSFDIMINSNKADVVLLNFKEEINCILDYERMKEKVYNSLSLGIRVHHNVLKVGDFITQRFKYSPESSPRTYIVRSLPQINRTHDYSFIQCCLFSVNLISNSENIVKLPIFFEDNRAKIEDREFETIVIKDSKYQFFTQDNQLTRKLGSEIKRIMIDGKCYKIIGTNTTSMKGLCYVGLVDSEYNPNTDSKELQIADYHLLANNPIPVEDVINGDDYIYYGETNNYTLSTGLTTNDWLLEGNGIEFVGKDNNSCSIMALNTSKYIGEKVQLKCVVNGSTYIKEITIKGF